MLMSHEAQCNRFIHVTYCLINYLLGDKRKWFDPEFSVHWGFLWISPCCFEKNNLTCDNSCTNTHSHSSQPANDIIVNDDHYIMQGISKCGCNFSLFAENIYLQRISFMSLYSIFSDTIFNNISHNDRLSGCRMSPDVNLSVYLWHLGISLLP